MIQFASKFIVSVIFALILVAFFAPTALLVHDFQPQQTWLTFLATDSHLFFYFPTFGLIALVAFFLPALIAFDFYWQHTKLGKARALFIIALAFAASGLSATAILSTANKPAWEIVPAAFYADRGEPSGCAQSGTCERLPVLDAYTNLRKVGQDRGNLKPFVRICSVDTWIDRRIQIGPERLCIASNMATREPKLASDQACCAAQARLVYAINTARANPETGGLAKFSGTPLRILQRRDHTPNRSLTADVHALALPFKLFFFFALLLVSAVISINFKKIKQHYDTHMGGIELGLLIGTPAVLFFPLMSQAFLFGNEALFGDIGHGFFSRLVPWISFAFGLWTMLILLFFYRGRSKQSEIAAKIIGASVGVITLIKYEAIIALLMKIIGVGADWTVLAAVALLSIMVTIFAAWKIATATSTEDLPDTKPVT